MKKIFCFQRIRVSVGGVARALFFKIVRVSFAIDLTMRVGRFLNIETFKIFDEKYAENRKMQTAHKSWVTKWPIT